MIFGIICSSKIDLYASMLIAKLCSIGYKPSYVLCQNTKKDWRLLIDYLNEFGFANTIRAIFNRYNVYSEKSTMGHVLKVLTEYASQYDLKYWRLPVQKVCQRYSIPYKRVESLNSESTIGFIKAKQTQILLNTGRMLIKVETINAVQKGILNAHSAMLPHYRGYNAFEWNLFLGDPIGVTLHYVNEGIDDGDILVFRKIPFTKAATIDRLIAKIYPVNVDLMAEYLPRILCGDLPVQNNDKNLGKQYYAMHPKIKVLLQRNLLNSHK